MYLFVTKTVFQTFIYHENPIVLTMPFNVFIYSCNYSLYDHRRNNDYSHNNTHSYNSVYIYNSVFIYNNAYNYNTHRKWGKTYYIVVRT